MLQEAIRERFKSNAKAAVQLRAQWMKQDSKTAKGITPESLATKIGELLRGKTDWWARRPALTQQFADMLDLDVLDLLGRPVVPPGSLHFPEFPALAPLRPDEAPPRIHRDGWLLDRVRATTAAGIHTIVAGPGMGKSFVVRWLQVHATDDHVAVTTPTLVGALPLAHDPRCLVIEIDERDPTSDAAAMTLLEQRGAPTIVLAPFGASDDTAPVFDARARNNLLTWIAQRLDLGERDTRLDLDEVRTWLQTHDPDRQHIATPADLLAFCADVDASGLDDAATWQLRARRWLRTIAPSLLLPDPPAWSNQLEPLADALCRAMLTRREHPWGALPVAASPTLIPDDLRGPDSSRWGRAVIVQGLRAAGLLRGADGGLALSPTWVRHGLAAATLDTMLAQGDAKSWGLFAADESRQHLVDAALDRRSHTDFCSTVRAVARDHDHRSLGIAAAREAIFTAAARRLLRQDFTVPAADLPAWHRLVDHQIASLKIDAHVCHPLTRPNWSGHDMFWADAWTFSLHLPKPASFDHPALAWHFPTWHTEFPPPTQMHWPSSSIGPNRASEGVRRMIHVAIALLPKLSALPPSPPGRELPRVLLPAAVLLAPHRGWSLPPAALGDLPGSWEGNFLLRLLSHRPTAECVYIADLLWNTLPHYLGAGGQIPVVLRLARLKNTAASFLPFILDNLSEAALLRTCRTDGVLHHADDIGTLRRLPRERRRLIVRECIAAAHQEQSGWHTARTLVPLLDAEDIDLLLDIISDSDKFIAAEFTGLVWQLAPDHASERTLVEIAERRPAAHAWCNSAPREHLAELADLLHATPPLADWVAPWAESRLLASGDAAEALYALVIADSH